MINKNAKTILALLTVYLIWGSTYLVIRYAIEEIPPLLMAGSRFIVASLPLFLILWWRGTPSPTLKQTANASVIGILMLAGGIGGVTYAEQWVASSLAAVVVATVPMWVAIWAGLFGRWPSRFEWMGLLLGFVGVLLLNLGNGLRGNLFGTIILLCSPVFWSLGSALSQKLDLPKGPLAYAIEMFAGGSFLMLLSVLWGENIPTSIGPVALSSWGYLVVFGSLLGFSAYMFLLNSTSNAVATSYAYVNPIVAVFLGVWVANEQLSGMTIIAVSVVIAGVILLSLSHKFEKWLGKPELCENSAESLKAI